MKYAWMLAVLLFFGCEDKAYTAKQEREAQQAAWVRSLRVGMRFDPVGHEAALVEETVELAKWRAYNPEGYYYAYITVQNGKVTAIWKPL